MCKYFRDLVGKKTFAAFGASFFIWALLLSIMASDPLPETLQPGVYETINLEVPRLNRAEEGEDVRRRYLMLPVG